MKVCFLFEQLARFSERTEAISEHEIKSHGFACNKLFVLDGVEGRVTKKKKKGVGDGCKKGYGDTHVQDACAN